MDKTLDIFYFSSTHWDREWYQDFQGFRYRLVKMTDKLIDLFESDPDYKTFHFDGQTIVLEDYVEICPEKKAKLKKLIEERKILIGPWYVMPDEFLLSGESLIRNLMTGHKISKEWGTEAWKYGYICDIFGHIAQMPQIFKGFDLNYSILGRGTTETDPAYFKWTSPDGSYCNTFKLPLNGGYGEFKQDCYAGVEDKSVDNPVLIEKIKAYIDKEIERSNIPVITIMDGLDHSDASVYTTQYIKKIAEMYPNAKVHHVNLCEQGKMLDMYEDKLPVVMGELNRTPHNRYGYLHLITNTLSSHYPVKKANDECQNLMEKQLEPAIFLSKFDNVKLNKSYSDLAYKYLIQNHPHDSICGCSIDQVHKDMEYRFDQVKDIGKAVLDDYLYQIKREEPENLEKDFESILTFYNLLPFDIEKTVTADINFKQHYPEQFAEGFGYEFINSFKIYDYEGNEIPYQITDIKNAYRVRIYDQFSEDKDVYTVSMKVKIPACGRSEYKIVPFYPAVRYPEKMASGADYAENEFIKVKILNNGSLELTDKKTGKIYTQLCNLADDGEIGDGWYHANPVNDRTVYSNGGNCTIEKVESGVSRCVFKITKYLEVPRETITYKYGMKRSEETVTLKFVSYIGLSEENRYVDVKMRYFNEAKDHRLRLVLPTGITENKYFAGQAFYCCERNTGMNFDTKDWREPDQFEKSTNGIVGKRDSDGNGIAFVAAAGIHECSAYNDKEGTLNITLSRSVRNTPMAPNDRGIKCQLNTELEYDFIIAPVDNGVSYSDLVKIQDIMACPVKSNFVNVNGKAEISAPLSNLKVEGENILTSIIKCSEDGAENTVVIRVFNASNEMSKGKIFINAEIEKATCVNLNEEYICDIESEKNVLSFDIEPWKIRTFKIQVNI
ncbi:MAG: hypothetical protein IJC74_06480 [Clostridia bacterium]|nr:hypothetical protein [Clostridia bacterium]